MDESSLARFPRNWVTISKLHSNQLMLLVTYLGMVK